MASHVIVRLGGLRLYYINYICNAYLLLFVRTKLFYAHNQLKYHPIYLYMARYLAWSQQHNKIPGMVTTAQQDTWHGHNSTTCQCRSRYLAWSQQHNMSMQIKIPGMVTTAQHVNADQNTWHGHNSTTCQCRSRYLAWSQQHNMSMQIKQQIFENSNFPKITKKL